MRVSRYSLLMGAMTLALAACGSADTGVHEVASSDPSCVTLEEGYYFWDGTAFVVGTVPASAKESVPSTSKPDWQVEAEEAFAAAGYPWMRLVARQNVAVLIGLAPNEEIKTEGLETGIQVLEAHPVSALEISLIADGITAESGTRGPAQSLAALMETSLGVNACQAAFDNTMRGRKIRYQSDLAIISPVSNGLLESLSGIAMLCDAHRIEIGEHTDNRGNESYNETLSRQRAEKIRDYMLGKGVRGTSLFAKGYGEALPIDESDTPEARELNRRTEFLVIERQ